MVHNSAITVISVGERGKKKIVMELILLLLMMSIKRVAINPGQD